MKVTVKDFQTLKGENTFEFPEGITILQGESASGKSSLIYAIKNCLTNPSGVDYVINWDAKQTEVKIENNGASVTWIKTPTSSTYVNNLTGEQFVKASKLDSRDIGDLGFYFDHKENVVNIQDEWTTLFPFGFSDTEMFKQFEEIFNIISAYQIIDEIKKDEQEIKTQINNVTKQVNDLKTKQNNMEQILSSVDENKLDEFIQILTTKQDVIKQMNLDYTNLSKTNTLKSINIPEEFDITSLNNQNNYCSQLLQDYNSYKVTKNILNVEIPEIKQFDIKENTYMKDYTEYVVLHTALRQHEKDLRRLDEQESQVREKLKEIKVCPTCGHALEEDLCMN